MTSLSILDLVRVTQDTDARGAFDNARDLAAHAERWGYRRFWVAEHHNMPGVASAATAVVLSHIAAGTRTIRVGAGGIMLPNHAPIITPSSSGPWRGYTPAVSTLASGGRRAQISSPSARCAGLCRAPTVFRRTCLSCRPSSHQPNRTSPCRPYRRQAPMCHCGFSDPAPTVRSSPQR